MKIISSAYQLASIAETLGDLCKLNPEWKEDKIRSKTGIDVHYIKHDSESTETMAVSAAKKIISKIDKKSIDGLIYVTQSPSSTIPTRACLMQDILGLKQNLFAFDINQGCSGFVYGLSVAAGLSQVTDAGRILIICTETYSCYTSKSDRSTRPIFSDGAAAVLVDFEKDAKINPFVFSTDGSGAKYLTLIEKEKLNTTDNPALYHDGANVLKFVINKIPIAVESLLEKSHLTKTDIDLFVFHQASAVVLERLRKKLNIDESKWYVNIESVGNTVSATIPLALTQAKQEGILKEGMNVMLMGFGVGLSIAGCILTT